MSYQSMGSVIDLYLYLQGKTKLYYSTMLEIYEKLSPIVGSKSNVKEETIEDVEMEDAMYGTPHKSHTRFDGKKESSVSSASKTASQTSQKLAPHESENNKVKAGSKTEQSETTQDSKSVISVKTEHSTKDIKVENKEDAGAKITKSEEGEESKKEPKTEDSAPSKLDVKSTDKEPQKEDLVQQASSPVTKKDEEKPSEQDAK